MRTNIDPPPPFGLPLYVDHPRARELLEISRLLDAHPEVETMVHQDLVRGLQMPHQGRPGMTARQVLRVMLIKQMTQLSYQDLCFALADSVTYCSFCGFGRPGEVPRHSALQDNVARLTASTLEQISGVVLNVAQQCKVETGTVVRVDCTVTQCPIHPPSDSTLLLDTVRRLTLIMNQAQTAGVPLSYTDHTRAAKRRVLAIQRAASDEQRMPLYQDLVNLTFQTVQDALHAADLLYAMPPSSVPQAFKWEVELRQKSELGARVIDQTQRRVFEGTQVPAAEKLVSIFEWHTDIIVKDRRGTYYGHKLCLSLGKSSVVLDCQILSGNPADVSLTVPMIERHVDHYQVPPQQAAFDGAFASKDNLRALKARGVKEVAFNKRRDLPVEEMTSGPRVYRRLRRFRAGAEGVISFLKRVFGLNRCTWKGPEGFAAYVWASIVTANLLSVARHLL